MLDKITSKLLPNCAMTRLEAGLSSHVILDRIKIESQDLVLTALYLQRWISHWSHHHLIYSRKTASVWICPATAKGRKASFWMWLKGNLRSQGISDLVTWKASKNHCRRRLINSSTLSIRLERICENQASDLESNFEYGIIFRHMSLLWGWIN